MRVLPGFDTVCFPTPLYILFLTHIPDQMPPEIQQCTPLFYSCLFFSCSHSFAQHSVTQELHSAEEGCFEVGTLYLPPSLFVNSCGAYLIFSYR